MNVPHTGLRTGPYHLQVPRDPKTNILWRRDLLAWAKGNPKRQAALTEACAQDILFWINAFIWQNDPRKKEEESRAERVGPFCTWPIQERALLKEAHVPWDDTDDRPEDIGIMWAIDHGEDLLVEKSRDMGASWLLLLALFWCWRFRRWQKFLVISRNEDAVDDPKDPDSLLWKADFFMKYLPDWLQPEGYNPHSHRQSMVFENPEYECYVNGQASTGKAGVGGRATAMLIDEFSQIREDFEVLHRTSDTTDCRLFNGTHKGTNSAFHQVAARVDMHKLVLHWTDHPEKRKGLYSYDKAANQVRIHDTTFLYPADFQFVKSEAPAGGPRPGLRSPWYDRACLRKGDPRAVAMDLDIDPGGSVSQFFNPLTLRELKERYAREPLWQGDLHYDRDAGRPLGLVAVPGGPLRLWLNPIDGQHLPIGSYGAGADLSAGQGATNSTLSVINAQTGEKVAAYDTPHIPPKEIAPLFMAVCYLFCDEFTEPALFAWEHHGPGQLFGKTVLELGYRRVYFREGDIRLAGAIKSKIPGWYPAPQQKRLLLDEFRHGLSRSEYVERDELVYKEALEYRYDTQGNVGHPMDYTAEDPTGAGVNHGDRVMGAALAWKMVKQLNIRRPKHEAQERPLSPADLAWRHQMADNAPQEDEWTG